MAGSGADRPDLARALAKNRMLFSLAVYRIEVRLALHSLGIGTVDISGLVGAFEGLRAQVSSTLGYGCLTADAPLPRYWLGCRSSMTGRPVRFPILANPRPVYSSAWDCDLTLVCRAFQAPRSDLRGGAGIIIGHRPCSLNARKQTCMDYRGEIVHMDAAYDA